MMNNDVSKGMLEGLTPGLLWKHFFELSSIPHCSGDEARTREYVQQVAEANGAVCKIDQVGNIVVKKAASAGLENKPIVVLQSHLDMVCEKNKDTAHDFSKDALKLKQAGDWLKADGTTLGADNGIGVAAQLAVLEDRDVRHGPLELLFTIDEETGLVGASDMAGDMLQGRMLLNLDSEEDGVIYIGCAGGLDTDLALKLETEAVPAGYRPVRVRVGGLQGGHSGLNIHEGRGNAIKILVRFLWQQAPLLQLRLAGLDGGSKKNAIPRECDAYLCLPESNLEALKRAVADYQEVCLKEYKAREAGIYIDYEDQGLKLPDRVFGSLFQERLVDLLFCLPHGVMAMSPAIPGLVETSMNLGVVKTGDQYLYISTNQRSSLASRLQETSDRVAAAGRLARAEVQIGSEYPGWEPNIESPLLKHAGGLYPSLFGQEPEIKAIHAGLECGIIGAKFLGMDMISFGPTINGAHSPDEQVEISTVKRFWDFLVAILEQI